MEIYLGIGPRDYHTHEEEAAQGPSDGGADERDDVVDGAKFPRHEADADGDHAGQAGCRKDREQRNSMYFAYLCFCQS